MKNLPTLVGREAFDVGDQQWSDWQWQFRHRLKTREDLSKYLTLSDEECKGFDVSENRFSVAVTPYFLSLMRRDDAACPLRQQVMPTGHEARVDASDLVDPLGEDTCTVSPGLVQKYPDRVLFLPTDTCAAYCRYCTRSRLVNQGILKMNREQLDQAIDYVTSHPEVRDVLISGGDPLIMKESHLVEIIERFNAIEHVDMVRIGTRVPSFLPQRITPSLVKSLRDAGVAWLSVHFCHAQELSPEVERALACIADGGIAMGCQTVLIKGVNNDADTLKSLFHGLLKNRVKPYYLHQCDPVAGSAHLRTSLDEGLSLMRALRGHTTGYAVPTYAVDLPNGGGKIALEPDYIESRDGKALKIRSYNGQIYDYLEVENVGELG